MANNYVLKNFYVILASTLELFYIIYLFKYQNYIYFKWK